ncbi:hydrogen peroxide-inducible genes activator [Hugenholtzia roseola]|uniref:hydrogen peroxide-inducible genes activator n=1 Tax=Hugenholtzia roseola TaxID=1002 RepID=UPI00040051CC|nr:hydrogen peroxide-inducible genes activator [Hugenholtzia roseola]
MNFQQLQYITALAQTQNFVKAADLCSVTQATLSQMVKKLEEELGVKIFDRSRLPIVPTEIGFKIIKQAQLILQEQERLHQIVQQEQTLLQGELKLGIIPTLAPYLLPLFVKSFLEKYSAISLKINELTTEEIVKQLENQTIDVGILALPLGEAQIKEMPLFYEEFVAFSPTFASSHREKDKVYILPKDLDFSKLWLLEEGHCLRHQVLNLCELKARDASQNQLDFETGSLETLKKMVKLHQGITILPALALLDLSAEEKGQIRYFEPPAPVRQIGMVSYRYFVKERLILALKQEILSQLPSHIERESDLKKIVPIKS